MNAGGGWGIRTGWRIYAPGEPGELDQPILPGVSPASRGPCFGQRGSASLVIVGLLAALLMAGAAAVGACALLASKQQVSAAADAAALAAADAASGLVPGAPCERAAQAARLNGARLGSCQVNGLVVLVSAEDSVAGVPIAVWARAGPPPAPAG
ncbi:Rv3654c family TadE-like protein [Rathayibacter sp. KR2-224]|uniref:Rv3654c family TadE-like protein n=1 Tax=Rathayibacter sp. KR2-224 TaxID=3400913 RepID=UPI003C0048D2